jgi:hypothetical protein
VFEFVVVVDRGVLCSPRFHGIVTLHPKELQPIHGDRDDRACHHLLPVGLVLHLPLSLHGAAAGQARRVCTSSDDVGGGFTRATATTRRPPLRGPSST